ncbi:nicotinate-nucleotide diphosphorylase [Desulfonema ishimotonii]|uniref:Probable nicotinate-nucleotide pyrophosphorylase [carboxylating] n=1 Tax=Desulfonema ishimotonii TaxID=45657 RepID=A0A401G2L5_9BACT|nr:carboxylating nicotinate-nucleotide diphosphorylase [Desulfonema ishimotonii]GBC63411.1 nicotinate-nucleotide diphosphorylase [Desulfonema ishimotonii]
MDSVKKLIEMALTEDIGPGDITTENIFSPEALGKGEIIAKEPLILAGLDVARQTFEMLDPAVEFTPLFADGDRVERGQRVLKVAGRVHALLKGERTALNFLQRLSGIATQVRSYADCMKGKTARLVDTRKTTPGWRTLEKYAVRVGGAYNHRTGLYDGVLIKDNHIAACGGIGPAVERVRDRVSHLVKIEVEVEDLNGVREALDAGADVIMLDNMGIPEIRAAVGMIQGRALTEVSGNVTREALADLADTGADLISSGALTHSARSMDLSMRIA